MSVTVRVTAGPITTLVAVPEGISFDVLVDGVLAVYDEDEEAIGMFAPGTWLHATIDTDKEKKVKRIVALTLALAAAGSMTACSSRRQISVEGTGSERVQGTSWYRFCDGPNAFIWVQSYTDSEPDELEAVIYDHWACIDADASNDAGTGDEPVPDADSDGTVDEED